MQWQLSGGVDKWERPFLRLRVQADVELVCQRCLKSMPFRVDADTVLTQFADEATLDEAVEQDEDLEGILIEPELDVEMLVEDEMLLALPYAPLHATCDVAGGAEHEAARGGAAYAFRQYATEQYFNLGEHWRQVIELYLAGHWPVGHAPGKLIVI